MTDKLFLIHCGFYDKEVSKGFYESHTNFFVVASDYKSARLRAKENAEFKNKRMHIDGIQEIDAVDGHRVQVLKDDSLLEPTAVKNYGYSELTQMS